MIVVKKDVHLNAHKEWTDYAIQRPRRENRAVNVGHVTRKKTNFILTSS